MESSITTFDDADMLSQKKDELNKLLKELVKHEIDYNKLKIGIVKKNLTNKVKLGLEALKTKGLETKKNVVQAKDKATEKVADFYNDLEDRKQQLISEANQKKAEIEQKKQDALRRKQRKADVKAALREQSKEKIISSINSQKNKLIKVKNKLIWKIKLGLETLKTKGLEARALGVQAKDKATEKAVDFYNDLEDRKQQLISEANQKKAEIEQKKQDALRRKQRKADVKAALREQSKEKIISSINSQKNKLIKVKNKLIWKIKLGLETLKTKGLEARALGVQAKDKATEKAADFYNDLEDRKQQLISEANQKKAEIEQKKQDALRRKQRKADVKAALREQSKEKIISNINSKKDSLISVKKNLVNKFKSKVNSMNDKAIKKYNEHREKSEQKIQEKLSLLEKEKKYYDEQMKILFERQQKARDIISGGRRGKR